MAIVVVSSWVDDDSADIFNYLAKEAGRQTAFKYDGLFDVLYDRLAEYPESGALRPGLGSRVRIGIVSPFLVIYSFTASTDTVTILRIVHGSRRITRRLLRQGPREEK